MAWRKAPPELIDLFDAVAPSKPPAVRRKMFGYPCVFANDNMFAGLHQESMILRLPDDKRARFLELAGAAIFEPMPGRRMREYVTVPPQLMDEPTALRRWMKHAFAYAVELPAKASRAGKKVAKKKVAKKKVAKKKVARKTRS